MLTIFTDKITNRLNYTLSLLFKSRGIDYKITENWDDFLKIETPKLIYSREKSLPDVLSIKAANLLFEDTIIAQEISKVEWNKIEILRFSDQPDILASIFYVVALYDDFTQKEKDNFGRLKGENSLLFQLGWLDKLMVERWSENLIAYIENQSKCMLNQTKIDFKITPTFDIDHAYAYKLRSSWRLYLSLIKDVFLQKKVRIIERSEVLNGKLKDPFETYAQIQSIAAKKYDVKVFWLLGDYRKRDRNCSFKNKKHQELIQNVSQFADVGLHPSYASNSSFDRLKKEKNRIESILKKEIKHCRQHYLKISLPETFEKLEKAGFTDDYSLGYADKFGFRAGISRPFLWYNLEKDEMSNLTLHPISYMDGTLNEYLKLSINEAVNYVRELKAEVKEYGGEFIPLWHNETIGDYQHWSGWHEVLFDGLDGE